MTAPERTSLAVAWRLVRRFDVRVLALVALAAGALWAFLTLGFLSRELTKTFYDRPRPDLVPHGAYVYSASFPSGHSTLSAATYLILAMLISSLETRRRTKALAFGLAGALLVTVGASRVY